MRFLRKHRTALIALAVYHFVFFFPTLFMARLPSPNDVFFNFDPWAHVQQHDVQNSVLNDPPTSYFTLMTLLKHNRRAFHWNPFVGSGIPGYGSSASAVLSPFVLLPTLLLPLGLVFPAIVLLKLNAAFLFAYLWLREEGMGKRGAAVGAIVIAAAGAYAVRWWWQATNAAALYPALLWLVRRSTSGRRVAAWQVTLIALVYALAGYPAAMLYGLYLTIAYVIAIALRRNARLRIVPVAAAALAIGIAMPSVVPFIQFLHRSGYLVTRAGNALLAFPWRHLILFVFPDWLGNNAYHNWRGDPALGAANNYIAATVYLGVVPLAMILVALWNRRAGSRWFWFATLGVVLACMFGVHIFAIPIARLPLLRYTGMVNLVLLLPLPAGYLAGAATSMISRRRAAIASLLAALCAADLAVFAGRFYPFISFDIAVPPRTPTVEWLQTQPSPFRIAAFTSYLWPNTAELYGLEDVRSHFSSEESYRRILRRIDPTSSSDQHTLILFDYLKFNFADPFTGMLGIRYYLEHPAVDVLRWTVSGGSRPAFPSVGPMKIAAGTRLRRHVTIAPQPFYSIGIPVSVRDTFTPRPAFIVTLSRGSEVLFERAFTKSDIAPLGKVYVPVYERVRPDDTALLEVCAVGMNVELLRTAPAGSNDDPFFYDRVEVPLMFDRLMPDSRVFRNAGEVPRFHSVTRLSKMTPDAFLAQTMTTDFRDEAVLTGTDAPVQTADAQVRVQRYEPDHQRVEVDAPAPTFLASSEKLTPELRVTIDDKTVRPYEINLLFAGVPVPQGKHIVVFSRRIGRGWWWVSAACLIAAVALSVFDVRLVARPR